MAIAVFLIARLAARLIHPQAAWFAAFACLGLKSLNYEAADARPYALGICVAAASLTFLIRWLDSARWRDALLFTFFAALVWRVHLIFWPFYFVFAVYVLMRLLRHETWVTWAHAGFVFGVLALALTPVLIHAISLFGEAKAHVIAALPTVNDLTKSLKYGLIFQIAAGAFLFRALVRRLRGASLPSSVPLVSLSLIAGWWLFQPLCLYGFSWLTGNSVFVARYLSLALPGAALAATVAASLFIPRPIGSPAAALLAVGVLVLLGQWREAWPMHHNSNWRAAAAMMNDLPPGPVICPSPFIEAKAPVWQPGYRLPGFLYSHLSVYPVRGDTYLFPFEIAPEAERFATTLAQNVLPASGHFVIYGGDHNVLLWRDWFARRQELAGWTNRRLGPFGDVEAVVFEKPSLETAR